MRKGKKAAIFFLMLAGLLHADTDELFDDSLETRQHLRMESPRFPDEELFLDPYIFPFLQDLEGQSVLDAGCGAAHWAIIAAQNGAMVDGIDSDKGAIDRATLAVLGSGMEERITLVIGDAADLPYPNHVFDRALSLNVGCHLPSKVRRYNRIYERLFYGLGPHVKQIARVLKKGGLGIVAAPASLGVIFTDGTSQEKARARIQTVLQDLRAYPLESEIISCLNQLQEVHRATFVMRKDRLELVTDEGELGQGHEIWRKLPEGAVKNRYHSEAEYLKLFKAANLEVTAILHPKFSSEEERENYNRVVTDEARLGPEYLSDNPFVIYWLKSKAGDCPAMR